MSKHPPRKHAARYAIDYRAETPTDLPFLTRLYRSTREAELNRVPWPEAEKQNFIEMQFRAQHSHYKTHYPEALWLVIERDQTAIGRLYLERWSNEHRIIDIALCPEARGQGFGAAILQDVMEEAAIAGKAVGIHVEKSNPAMTLYRRLGFQVSEDKGVYDLMIWKAEQPQLLGASPQA